ncbi:MAG: DNA polymerase I [Gemmatimonadetes bacterium SCN 70-22]|nr:MAG: DNA polymerase I [Gemmatimonadetes bacterium SCN 70-22]
MPPVSSASPPSSPTLFLVDGYALIYRAFFALLSRPLTTARGENTSAAWGVVNFLQRLMTKHRPDYIGWVHDSGLSFRHEKYPAYKATREKLTEELQADFDTGVERITQLLAAFRVPILAVDGFEADDVIGTLAAQGVERGLNVVIVSGDKDFQQLVRPGVWLLNPGRGGPASVDEQWVGMENAGERLGVAPAFVTDFLALVGDSSDNVPGVPGIGEKTAKELVDEYGNLESILDHASEVRKKRPREALLAHPEQARLSKDLVTIRDNVPIALELESLERQQPDATQLRQLYTELEFTSLIRDLESQEPIEREPRQDTRYTVVDTPAGVEALVKRIREVGRFAFDTETVAEPGSPSKIDPLRASLVSISVALDAGEAYYLPLAHRSWESAQGSLSLGGGAGVHGGSGGANRGPGGDSIAARALAAGATPVRNLPPLSSDAMQPLRDVLADPAIAKIGQNMKFDILVLRNAGIAVGGAEFDTMLASYVLDPGRRSHSLDVLAFEFLEHAMTSYEALCGRGKQELPFDVVPIGPARDYSCEDADMTWRLRTVFEPQVEGAGMSALFRDIEMPLVDVLVEMEWQGVSIDVEWFRSLKARFQRERERVEEEIYAAAGERFNINSNPQLRTVLFERLQLPVKKRTATGASTDASVLQELADEGHVLPTLLMEYRELAKLESTYLDTLPALIHPRDGRLHTSYNQTVAATGRLSSSDPNLQNIPIRRELGRDIRRGFVPQRGWKFVGADYSQVELRLLAHLSHDEAFVRAFKAGGDIHKETAAIIFGVDVEAVTPEMRARAKTINFATIYGQGAHALSRQLKISNGEARDFIATYFERFRGVRAYLDSMVEIARTRGYVETIFHRRRYIPELKDRNFNIRAFGERVATNAPIQGSAADLIKIAMIRIHRALTREGMASRMLLQVHDELVFEAPPDEVDSLSRLVKSEMESAADLDVPLLVELGVGDNWLDTK